jgi:hypothetical protein
VLDFAQSSARCQEKSGLPPAFLQMGKRRHNALPAFLTRPVWPKSHLYWSVFRKIKTQALFAELLTIPYDTTNSSFLPGPWKKRRERPAASANCCHHSHHI